MSGLCGWFAPRGARNGDEAVLAAMAEALRRFDLSPVTTASNASGAAAVAGLAGSADIAQDAGRLVAVYGHVRFADAQLTAVQQRQGAAKAVMAGYERYGAEVLSRLSDAFALAILDAQKATAVLATDRMGSCPLNYSELGGTLVFGSTLDAISAFPNAPAAIDPQAIYDYVYFHMVPGPRTVYQHRYRLLPGHCLLVRDGETQVRPYWEMRYRENENRPFPELKQSFLACLRESVSRSAQSGPVGTFLSGGTDSSTVAGMLGEVTGEPARTYSIGFEAEGYDEMEYARIAARRFATRHHEYYVTPADVVEAIPRIAAVHDQPFGNASAVPTYYCAKLAKDDGIAVLLGGDGGDELFGGNERYAKQHLYSLYSDLPAPLRKGLIEPIAFLPPEVGIVGKAQRYLRNASQPMPARYDNYNLLERLGPRTVFTEEFLLSIDQDAPRVQLSETYSRTNARALINRMLALDLKYTLADNDLPKVAHSCELAGVSVRFPLIYDAMVNFSASLAPKMKLKGTRLRYFFKEALRGFLPDEIIAKTKHGFGLPFGPWITTHAPLRDVAFDSISGLKHHSIVRPEFLDELTSKHLESHAAYYGTMIWVLMMLGQWLTQRRLSP